MTSEGNVDQSPCDIALTFHAYYTALYNICYHYRDILLPYYQTRHQEYIKSTKFLLYLVLSLMPCQPSLLPLKFKSPGPNRFTHAFYKHFKEDLSPTMKSLFNAISPQTPLPKYVLEAHVALIPNSQKVPT